METGKAVIRMIGNFFKTCDRNMAESIKNRNWKQLILNVLLMALLVIIIALFVVLFAYLILHFWWVILIGAIVFWSAEALLAGAPIQPPLPPLPPDFEVEFIRQQALDLQETVLNFMLRVLVAISSNTVIIRPRTAEDIAVYSTDGASFYMRGEIVIYQAGHMDIIRFRPRDFFKRRCWVQRHFQPRQWIRQPSLRLLVVELHSPDMRRLRAEIFRPLFAVPPFGIHPPILD